MNYLAHAYLSFGNPDILAGNLISDFVKGKKKLDYPEAIQKGIVLHRAIDTFTDTHPVTQQAKAIFRPVYGLYSGALTDVIYDHYLANDPGEFTPETREGGVDLAGRAGAIGQAGSGGTGGKDVPVGTGGAGVADTADGTGEGRADEDGADIANEAGGPSETLAAFAQKTYRQLSVYQAVFPERFARMYGYMQSQNWLYNYRTREGIFNSLAGLARKALYMPDADTACRLFEEHYTELGDYYAAFFPALKEHAFTTLQGLLENPGKL